MELKPTGRKAGQNSMKPLASIGAGADNPWEIIARGTKMEAPRAKRSNWARNQLGATPPRDGPFAPMAAAIAANMPIKTRTKRQTLGNWPPMGSKGQGR